MRRSLVGLFLFALTLGLLAVGGNTIYSALQDKWAKESKQKPHQERVFSVNVITAKAVNLVPVMTAFGEIRSQRTLDIRAASTGMIINLAPEFVEGGTVKSGAFLVGINPQDAQSALERARGDLTEARAELDEATRALALAGDEVESARSQAALRHQALLRQKDLRARRWHRYGGRDRGPTDPRKHAAGPPENQPDGRRTPSGRYKNTGEI